jgi:hypothetical protein
MKEKCVEVYCYWLKNSKIGNSLSPGWDDKILFLAAMTIHRRRGWSLVHWPWRVEKLQGEPVGSWGSDVGVGGLDLLVSRKKQEHEDEAGLREVSDPD